jgi:hypothetical protein
MTRKINEWIFGDLLEGISLHADPGESMFASRSGAPAQDSVALSEEEDGLMVSAAPVKVIPLASGGEAANVESPFLRAIASKRKAPEPNVRELDWLSQPLSGRGLAWAIHTLVVLAGILLFALVFLSITRDAPPWPIAMVAGTAAVITALYWFFFQIFGGSTLGARLARLAECTDEPQEEKGPRFR